MGGSVSLHCRSCRTKIKSAEGLLYYKIEKQFGVFCYDLKLSVKGGGSKGDGLG